MPNKHAMLSASSSARWLACPPSAQLCAALPDTVTYYALEGTCAHELAEYKVQKLLGNPASNPTENLDFYDAEWKTARTAMPSTLPNSWQICKNRLF